MGCFAVSKSTDQTIVQVVYHNPLPAFIAVSIQYANIVSK